MKCFNCGCEKPRTEFSQIEDIYQCTDPEDLVCDECYEQETVELD